MSSPNDSYPSDHWTYPELPGRPRDDAALKEVVRRLAPSRATVLLVGGTTEKTLVVARALHDQSGRASRPFVTVDCEALAPDVFEDVLFGGPSYGASAPPRGDASPPGAVRTADCGTLYIATIDRMPVPAQPRFLRFLDDTSTVRVVASTRVDLAALAWRRQFRVDLGERLLLIRVDLSHV